MSRDMQKLIDEYDEKFPYNGNKGPKIGAGDLQLLYQISNGDSFRIMDNSLSAGFMIGYKYAKNEKHNRKRIKA